MGDDTTRGSYTNKQFPKDFLKDEFYINSPRDSFTRAHILKSLHGIFDKLKPDGCDVLDFGCGPTIYAVMSASQYAKSITLAEYSETNRAAISMWIERQPDAHDWTPYFKAVADMEGCTWTDIEDRLRKSLKGVEPCDIRQDNVIGHDLVPGGPSYDIIISSLCLNAACFTVDEYAAGVRKLGSLLKPGGVMIISEFLDNNKCQFGDQIFRVGQFSIQDVEKALNENAFMICDKFFAAPEKELRNHGAGLLVLYARKSS